MRLPATDLDFERGPRRFDQMIGRTTDYFAKSDARDCERTWSRVRPYVLNVNFITRRRRRPVPEKDEAPHQRTGIAIREALEDADVVFIDENGGGAGVRLRKAKLK